MVKPGLLVRTGDDLNILDASVDAEGIHLRLHRPGSEKQVVVTLKGTDLGLAKLLAMAQFAAVLVQQKDDADKKRQAAWEEHVKSLTGEDVQADGPKAGRKGQRLS